MSPKQLPRITKYITTSCDVPVLLLIHPYICAASCVTRTPSRPPDQCGGVGRACCPQYQGLFLDKDVSVVSKCIEGAFCGRYQCRVIRVMYGMYVMYGAN